MVKPEMYAIPSSNDSEQLKSIDRRITQHVKLLEKLRDDSAFIAAKLEHDLKEKQCILKSISIINNLD